MSFINTPGNSQRWYNRPKAVITVIFAIKLLSVLFMVYQERASHPARCFGIAATTEDTDTYIGPIENYIHYGRYFWGEAQAGRMPYVGLVYYPFRLIFSKSVALSIVVILQIIGETFAIYLLGKLCQQILGYTKAFWLFVCLACCSLYVTYYDYFIMAESLSCSFTCYFVYFYYQFFTSARKNKLLLTAALFLALAVLFKPYLALLYGFIIIELLIYSLRGNDSSLKRLSMALIILMLPIVILNTPWTIRNYYVLKKICTLSTRYVWRI